MKIFKNNDGEPYRLYNYQLPIVETLFFKKHRRTTCKATTRAGKSEAVAIACILIATILKNEKILIIAPTTEHAKIIMNYVAKHIIDSKDIIERLDIDLQGKKAEKIKSEISKKKLTFKTGSSIEIKSATISHGGRGLIGEGGSIIIIDEVALIPEEIYRTAILRMLGDSPNSILFEIGNSVARNHFQDHHNNPEWHKISISHEDCIAEGRLTKEFVESQRRELLPIEFRMWYEAEFPEEAEDSVFKEKWINQAVKLYEDNMNLEVNIDNEMHMGCDIARYGVDLSVHTNIEKTMDFWIVRNILATGERSTMATVGDIIELDRKFHTKMIKIDEGRYGGSLIDRLREDDVGIGHKIMEVQFGSLPMRDKKRFLNKKAEMYWALRDLFEKGSIAIPNNSELIKQLLKMRFEFTSNGKIHILKESKTSRKLEVGKGKSPDHADSLALAVYDAGGEAFILEDKIGII